MRFLKQVLAAGVLAATLGSCYVSTHPHYYAPRCAAGWYWDGYRCRPY
jgi:hypothetical protein